MSHCTEIMPYCTSCGNESLDDAVFCSKCGKPISNTGMIKKRSNWWYLLPIFFNVIGGIISYFALRYDDKKLAQNCLKLGIILFLINLAIGATIAVYDEFQHENSQVTIASGSGSSANTDCVRTQTCFYPNPITTTNGETVTWTNNDTLSHTVTSGRVSDDNAGSMFDSGLITSGQTFQFTFTKVGTYDYFCTVHPWMIGQVIVK